MLVANACDRFIVDSLHVKKKQLFFCGKIANFNNNSSTIIVIKLRKKGENEKRDNRGTRIGHVTKRNRRQNLAKLLQRLFQSWMNQWNCSEVNEVAQVFGKTSFNYWLWNVVRVWFFLKHCRNNRSKRIEAVRFHQISCGSWTEQVCNPFAQRRHHVPVWSNLRQNLNLNK